MSYDDGRDGWAPGPPPGPDRPHEAAGGSGPENQWAAPGAGVPSSGEGGWAAPGGGPTGASGPGYGHQDPGGYGGPAPPPPGYGRPWAPRPGLVSLRPLTLGDLFNGAFGYIRQNPKTTLGLALIVTALFNIVTAVGTGSFLSQWGTDMQEVMQDPYGPAATDPAPFEPWSAVAMYGGALVAYVGQILLTGLLAAVVGLAVLGRTLSMREALQAVRGRMGAVFGVAGLLLLLGLLWTALVIGVLVAAVALGVAVHPAAGVAAGLLGVPALIALIVWIYVRTCLAMPVAVLERSGPASALVRSWRLTQRSWWRLFGILLLAQILVAIVVNLMSMPFSGAAMVLAVVAADAPWTPIALTALSFVGTVLSSTLGTPFIVGVTTLLYIDLRMRREGLDLKLQAAAQSGEQVDSGVYVPDEATAAPAGAGSGGGHPYGGDPQGGQAYGGYPQGGHRQGGYPYGGYPQSGPAQGGYPQTGPEHGGYGHGGYGASS